MRVAVVGAGWSGLAVATFLQEAGHDVAVHEAGAALGGRIETIREGGYLVEAGPHALAAQHPATARLLEFAGVPVDAAPPRAPRFVVHEGAPVALPAKPQDALTTRLLTPRAKLRLLVEPLHGAGPAGETVAGFARRRLGEGVLDLVDAMTLGVYAGDPARLVIEHAFPRLHAMDRAGGLLRGLRRSAPRARLVAPREGMASVVRALAAKLDVRLGSRVVQAEVARDGVVIATERASEEYGAAVLALDPPALQRVLGITATAPPVAPVHVVAFGVPDDAAPPEGYGVLVPEREGRFILGALFESRLFPGRAPPGRQLVRCLVGGSRHPERAVLPPEEIARRAWRDLLELGLVRGEPARVFHVRTAGIPQPEAAHARWLAALPQDGRLRALGIGQRGVGLDALAADAERVAAQLGEV